MEGQLDQWLARFIALYFIKTSSFFQVSVFLNFSILGLPKLIFHINMFKGIKLSIIIAILVVFVILNEGGFE